MRPSPTSSSRDILTLAPALAGELAGLPVATLVPHVYPDVLEGWPPYSLGARLPAHAPRAASSGGARGRSSTAGYELGMREFNDTRAAGRPPAAAVATHGQIPRARARRDVSPARVPARRGR